MRNPLAATSLPLRLVHLLVFAGFALGGVRLTQPDLTRLLFAARHGYALGAPINPMSLAAALGCAGGLLVLIASAWRGQVPLRLSSTILLAFVVAVFVSRTRPDEVTWARADQDILQAAESLQLSMNGQLQKAGEVSANAADWQRRAVQLGETPVRPDGVYSRLYRAELIAKDAPLPRPVPGTLVVEVSPDRASFRIHPAGVDPNGAPAYLTDEKGAPVLLKAVFNPNRPPGDAAEGL